MFHEATGLSLELDLCKASGQARDQQWFEQLTSQIWKLEGCPPTGKGMQIRTYGVYEAFEWVQKGKRFDPRPGTKPQKQRSFVTQ